MVNYKQVIKTILAIFLSLMLIACNQKDLAFDVNQEQSNEIVALLNSYGIAAESNKGRGSKALFTVSVRSSQYQQAVGLLNDHKLPSKVEISFDELVANKGLIPNSKEIEALRIDRAMAREIEEILENHSQIANVKAIVRLNFIQGDSTPGVSVVCQTDSDLEINKEELISLIMSVIPGVRPEQIKLSLTPIKTTNPMLKRLGVQNEGGVTLAVPLVPFLIWMVPEGDLNSMVSWFLLIVVLTLVVGLSIGYFITQIKKTTSTDKKIFLQSGKNNEVRQQLPEI